MANTQKKITLLWGLPGSGKSHYAGELCPSEGRYRSKCHTVDCDTLWKREQKYGSEKQLVNVVAKDVQAYINNADHFIIDGLITTNQVARDIFMAISLLLKDSYDILFEIVWWTPNVEACLHNDRGRRAVDSRITIQNIVFEEPSQELIEEWNMKKRVTRKKIVRKPDWQVWAEEAGVYSRRDKEGKMKSDTWSLGGTSGSCWGPEMHTVSAGPQPTAFKEFDDLLERICPSITFLQYKKLYNESVTTDTKGEGDYYGGHVEYAFYVCDLSKLYETMVSMGIVKGIDNVGQNSSDS